MQHNISDSPLYFEWKVLFLRVFTEFGAEKGLS